MRKCRVALVGAGNMTREHIRAFIDVKGVEVCGITSRTRSKAEVLSSEFGPFHVFSTIKDLYHGTKADLVVVTVSVPSIKSVSLECFEFPWAVFLEKPIGIDFDEGLGNLKYAKARNSRIIVGLNRRFYSNMQAQKQELDKRKEEKRIIHVYDQQDEQKALKLGHPVEIVRNWMYANSIHLIDLFRYLGGSEIRSTHPLVYEKREKGEKDVVISKIMYENGNIGIYQGF